MAEITFGKYRGQDWRTLARTDQKYFSWALRKLDLTRFTPPDDEACDIYISHSDDASEARKEVNDCKDRLRALKYQTSIDLQMPEDSQDPRPSVNVAQTVKDFEAAMLNAFGMFPVKRRYYYD